MTYRLVAPALLSGLIFVTAMASGQTTPVVSADWQRVDALRPGSRVVVTTDQDQPRVGRFKTATADGITIAVGADDSTKAAGVTLRKSAIRKVTTYDPVRDGVLYGALGGAAAMVAWLEMGSRGCGLGCENDLPAIMPLLVGSVGAAAGSFVGFLIDRQSGADVLFPTGMAGARAARGNRFFPSRPSVRIGPTYTSTSYRSDLVDGSSGGAGFVAAAQLLPMLSAHVEYSIVEDAFVSRAGTVPEAVLQNLVPSASRVAGQRRGLESRQVAFMFSELVGIRPPPWGRLRLEFLTGAGVRGQKNRDYYDAYRTVGSGTRDDPARTEAIAGKYSILDFESSEIGFVFGADAEVAMGKGLVLVPMVRYNRMGNPGATFSYGLGANWLF